MTEHTQAQEREAFEAHMAGKFGKKPMTWREAIVHFDLMPVTEKLLDRYYMGNHQEAWEAWQARAGCASTPIGGGWQPIETAPKDAWLLVSGHTYRTNAGAVVAMYCGPDDWLSADDGYGAYIRPTHWMPLPPAPGHSGKEAK